MIRDQARSLSPSVPEELPMLAALSLHTTSPKQVSKSWYLQQENLKNILKTKQKVEVAREKKVKKSEQNGENSKKNRVANFMANVSKFLPLKEPLGGGQMGGLERTERGSSNTRQRETLWLAGHENAKEKECRGWQS